MTARPYLMLDGNSAAERQHNAAHYEPSDDEIESFVLDFIDRRVSKDGYSIIQESIVESSIELQKQLFQAYPHTGQIGDVVLKMIDSYLRPMAEREAEYHDFEQDAKESYAMREE